jgi:hypothetical protein
LNAENTEKSVRAIRAAEILISTSFEEADEATKLEYSAYDIEKCTVEKVAVVAEGEAAKDFKTNTEVKKYLRFEKCGKCLSLIPALLNQFAGATRAQEGADEEGEDICSQRTY